MKKTKNKKKTALRVATDIFLILFILSMLGLAGWLLWKEFFPNNVPILKLQVFSEEKGIDWDELRQINPDTVGWLKIEGTNIDTPIVQSTDNDRYLYTSFYLSEDSRGTPFLDYNYHFTEPRSSNSVIYGHSLFNSGTKVMFDALHNYTDDPNFFSEHSIIEYDRPPELGGDGKWAIFSVLQAEADYDYRQIDFADDASFMAYYQNIKAASVIPTDVSVNPGDEILTLSTCTFGGTLSDGRLAIIAKKIQ